MTYEVEINGQIHEIDAPNETALQEAVDLLRSSGAQPEASSGERRTIQMPSLYGSRNPNFRSVTPAEEEEVRAGERTGAMLAGAGAAASLSGLPIQMATAPVATAKALGTGLVGSAVGEEVGGWTGSHLPLIGGETASKILGVIGGLVGGGMGLSGPEAILNMAKHGSGKLGVIARLLAPEAEAALGKGTAGKVVGEAVKEIPARMTGTPVTSEALSMAERSIPRAVTEVAEQTAPVASTIGELSARTPTAHVAEEVAQSLKERVAEATKKAFEFGLKPGSKVHNITIDGKVLEWFPTPDKAKGAIMRLAKQYNWKHVGVGRYATPEGATVQLDWTQALAR